MQILRIIYWISLIILILGGINWALFGFFDYNLVEIVVGDFRWVPQIVYGLVGLGAVLVAVVAPLFTRKRGE